MQDDKFEARHPVSFATLGNMPHLVRDQAADGVEFIGRIRAEQFDVEGVFDPLVGFGLATKERLPLEYRDVYRFRPTAKGKKEIGEP